MIPESTTLQAPAVMWHYALAVPAQTQKQFIQYQNADGSK